MIICNVVCNFLFKFNPLAQKFVHYWPRGNEDRHKKSDAGYPVFGPRFKPRTFKIWSRIIKHLTLMAVARSKQSLLLNMFCFEWWSEVRGGRIMKDDSRYPTFLTFRKSVVMYKYFCWRFFARDLLSFAPVHPVCRWELPFSTLRALIAGSSLLWLKRTDCTNCLTLRLLMWYIYGAYILDVSRSHTTTQHSR